MNEWKNIKINGIAGIEKCVAEFNIWELNKTPYAKFKIKIFETAKGDFKGFSNLQITDGIGDYTCAVGYGKTIEEALEDTIKEFLNMVSEDKEWKETDFRCSDSFDF